MSADQLAAALKATHHVYVSDSDETAGDSNDKLQVPNTIHSAIGKAMSHTPTEPLNQCSLKMCTPECMSCRKKLS